jgi:hypothetical protein
VGVDLQQVQLASRSLISFQTPLQERLLYVQIRILAFVDESEHQGLGEIAGGRRGKRREVNWNICIGRSTLACSCRARSSCASSSTNPLLWWRRRHVTTRPHRSGYSRRGKRAQRKGKTHVVSDAHLVEEKGWRLVLVVVLHDDG